MEVLVHTTILPILYQESLPQGSEPGKTVIQYRASVGVLAPPFWGDSVDCAAAECRKRAAP